MRANSAIMSWPPSSIDNGINTLCPALLHPCLAISTVSIASPIHRHLDLLTQCLSTGQSLLGDRRLLPPLAAAILLVSKANLAAAVVFPVPCNPAISTIVEG